LDKSRRNYTPYNETNKPLIIGDNNEAKNRLYVIDTDNEDYVRIQ